MLADMGVQPQTLQASLVIASQSTDKTPPTSSISTVSSTNVVEGQTVTVTGTATDTGGGVMGGVQVSTDSGKTWHPASGQVGSASMNWNYSFVGAGAGNIHIEVPCRRRQPESRDAGRGASYTVTPSAALSLFSASRDAAYRDRPECNRSRRQVHGCNSGFDYRHPILQGFGEHRHACRRPLDRFGNVARHRDLHQRDRQRLAAGQFFQPGQHHAGHDLCRLLPHQYRPLCRYAILLRHLSGADRRIAECSWQQPQRRICLRREQHFPEQHLH